MPNIKSSKKDVISSKIAYEKNKANKSELKTNLKKFDAAVESGDKAAAEAAYKVAVKTHNTEVLINADIIELAQLSSVFSEVNFSEVGSLPCTSHWFMFSSQYKLALLKITNSIL